MKIKIPIIAQDLYSKQIKNLSNALGQIQSKIQASAGKSAKALDISAKAAQAGQAMSGARDAAMGFMGSIISEGRQFEQTLSTIGAVTGANAEMMERMSVEAQRLGATTTFSAAQAADGMLVLSRAGFSTEQSLIATEKMLLLAQAGNLELAQAAEIASGAMNAYNMSAKDVGNITNILARGANSAALDVQMLGETFAYAATPAADAGISIEELTAMAGLLADNNIKASMAGTALRGSILRLAKMPKQAASAFADMGIDVDDARFKSLTFAQKLPIIGKALNSVSDPQERMAIAARAFGTEAASAMLALTSSTQQLSTTDSTLTKYAEKLKKVSDASVTTADVAKKMTNNFDGAMKGMESAQSAIKIAIYMELKDSLKGLADTATKVFSAIKDFAKENPKLTTTLVTVAAAIAGALVVLTPLMFAISTISAGIAALTPVMAALKGGFVLLKTATMGGFTAIKSLWALMMANPIILIVAAIAGLVTWFGVAYAKAGSFTGAIKLMWEQVKGAAQWIGKLFGFGGGKGANVNVNQNSAPVINQGGAGGMSTRSTSTNSTRTEKSVVEFKFDPRLIPTTKSGSARGTVMSGAN